MRSSLLNLYHRLPYPLRCAMASARGYSLRRWRYGPETARLVDEALERETWSAGQWQRWREERLAAVLRHAALNVPYYRRQWEDRRRRGDGRSWERLENWPILEKETLREQPEAFLADSINRRHLWPQQTSGTTGKPLKLWHSRATLRAWYALAEARMRKWNGVSLGDRWAILGGQLVVPAASKSAPFWVWNAGLKQLYMSSYHLSPASADAYLAAISKYEVRYLLGYTSALYTLAYEIAKGGLKAPDVEFVMTNAEPVTPTQRHLIQTAFGRPVRETYGMSEMLAGASECAEGVLHFWPETGWMEALRDGRPEAAGEFICTGLLGMEMPLIRYRIGDSGFLPRDAAPCPCGRTLPALDRIEGRTDDMLFTRDGRCIGRLDPVFKADLHIREAQLIQERIDLIRVRYVRAPGFESTDEETIRNGLQQRMGRIDVCFEAVNEIPRGPSGKFRAVVCNLNPEERRTAQAGLVA